MCAAINRQAESRGFGEARREDLLDQLRTDWRSMSTIPITGETFERAVILTGRYRLRGADAIHLAATWQVRNTVATSHRDLVLLTSDRELLSAAGDLGIAVENPDDPAG